jgi:hypothetical protein
LCFDHTTFAEKDAHSFLSGEEICLCPSVFN